MQTEEALVSAAALLSVTVLSVLACCTVVPCPSPPPPPARFSRATDEWGGADGMQREIRDIEKAFGEHRTRMGVWREVGILYFPAGAGGEERVLRLLERGSAGERQWEYAARNREGVVIPIRPPQPSSFYGKFLWNDKIHRDEGTLNVLGYGTMPYVLTAS